METGHLLAGAFGQRRIGIGVGERQQGIGGSRTALQPPIRQVDLERVTIGNLAGQTVERLDPALGISVAGGEKILVGRGQNGAGEEQAEGEETTEGEKAHGLMNRFQ